MIALLLLDAIALGLIACVLGLALGDELSIHLLHSNPAFLSLAFTLGTERAITWQTVAIAAGGGMLAAIVAVLSPLRDILSRDPLAAIRPREGARSSARSGGRRAVAGLACLAAATTLLLRKPDAAIPGMILLLGAMLLELPVALSATLALVRHLAARITSATPHVAAMELSAAGARAIAIAATGAIAVFGSVAIRGSHDDLLAGLERAASDTNAFTDVWVSPAGAYNLLKTAPFTANEQAKLERLRGVRAVGLYRSGLLDYGERRVWVIAPPLAPLPSAAQPLPSHPPPLPLRLSSQRTTAALPAAELVQGDRQKATERMRAGGWLILSKALAEEHHLHIGEAFTLPSPDPRTFRLAGLSSNLGWAPGAIVMNAKDYARAWGSEDASAYTILLAPGFTPAEGAREIEQALGAHSGLAVQSAQAHSDQQRALSREALVRLSQIATLILVVAVLAMAAAMGALLWQRRPRLAKLKLEGFPRIELWRTILLESLLLLGVGCLIGAIFGLYGQQLADRALVNVVNFPVVYSVTAMRAWESLALVTASALMILAIPGYLAASVPAALALQD